MHTFLVRLDEDDFQCLVSGGVLKINYPDSRLQVTIILKDIGFHRMDHCITQAQMEKVKPYSVRERNSNAPVSWENILQRLFKILQPTR